MSTSRLGRTWPLLLASSTPTGRNRRNSHAHYYGRDRTVTDPAPELESAYKAAGVPVADVSTAFFMNTFTMRPVVNLPLNVATICVLTWMCAPAPVGPNIHPPPAGLPGHCRHVCDQGRVVAAVAAQRVVRRPGRLDVAGLLVGERGRPSPAPAGRSRGPRRGAGGGRSAPS